MTTRINARIDADLARKLAQLRRETGRSTTEVLRAAIEALYEAQHARPRPAEALSALVGVAEGPPELSSDTKGALSDGLSRKVPT